MSQDIKLSVIVPAYNIENYIERCVESIINQTYKNIEIIIVDDGSTDNTGNIVDRIANKDCRVKTIHKLNGGVTAARLDGVRKAIGDYIGFVDGDDYIEPEMYEKLVYNAIKYSADISHCGYQMVFPSHVDYYYNTAKVVEQDNIKGLYDLISAEYVEPGLWNKIYKRSLFDKYVLTKEYPIGIKINEDLLMNYFLFKNASKSIYKDICLYHYILRNDSATGSPINENKLKDPLRVLKIICKDNADENLRKIIKKRILENMICVATMSSKSNPQLINSYRKKILKKLRRKFILIISDKIYTKKQKMKLIITVICPKVYRVLHSIYAKLTGIEKKYRVE